MPRAAPHNRIQIKERRQDVLVLLTKGMKGYEIAKELGVDASTVSRDIHSQTDDSVKGDKIKALSLEECYAMKLDLLTNATVVDDAIRFVASHTSASVTTEKANSDDRVTVDEEVSNSSDIQRSEDNCSQQQQQSTTTTITARNSESSRIRSSITIP